MDKKLFADLKASLAEFKEIDAGRRKPSRAFTVETVKEARAKSGLSQSQFARLLGIDVGTLRNWEQGHRSPSGPARALITAINVDPENVLRALKAAA
jgi:DNA-binding transcriptional regulator YiaG